MYVLALSDYKQHAAAAGYKPAPPIRQINCSSSNKNESTTKSPLEKIVYFFDTISVIIIRI